MSDKKLTKQEIKLIATLHSAIHLSEVDIFMFDEHCDVSEEEEDLIIQEIKVIGNRLAKDHPMDMGSTEKIIDYVRSLRKES